MVAFLGSLLLLAAYVESLAVIACASEAIHQATEKNGLLRRLRSSQ
jgi:hypothetical protein